MVKVVYAGQEKRILWVEDGPGQFRGEEFFLEIDVKGQARLFALFKRFADVGRIVNEEKFRHEEDGIYCFKSGQLRIFCFFDGRDVLVTSGTIKKRRRLKRTELDRAKRIRNTYLEGQSN